MKHLVLTVVIVLSGINSVAQNALISEKEIRLLTYPFSDPDPVPELGRIFPYFRFDGYSGKGTPLDWKMVEMENDFIRLWLTPGIGGKIWGAIEKSTGNEFVYYNQVVKFRDIAMRGPWTSGGIEINFGALGHVPTSSTPVDYLARKNDDGSVSCFVGAIDLSTHTRWTVEVNLPKDKAYFTTRSIWNNPTVLEQLYYHWMNLAVKTTGNLEYVFPGNYHIGHVGEHYPWPVDEQSREISFYEKNNFGPDKSYHVFGEVTDFYGTYWHDDDFGFAHYSSYDEKPGKKIFNWAMSDQGSIWEKLLTDTDGQYTEIQSGRLFNQNLPGSSYTPFKNRGFAPGSADEWTEYWLPVRGTRGLRQSSPAGSVNLIQKDTIVNLWFCPNEPGNGNLEVRKGSKVIFNKELHSIPMQPDSASFEYNGNFKLLSVWLNNILLYDADREKYQIKRPVEMPLGFNWETTYGHYLLGKEFEQQRSFKQAEAEFNKAIESDNWFVPALTGLARINFRKTDYSASLDYSLKALSVNTYDAGANMMYGLAGLAMGDTTSAIDGFSIASEDISFRSIAYNSLSTVFIRKNNFEKALSYAEKSLIFNALGSDAAQLKILCLRKLELQSETYDELDKLEKKDPLNHFIRFERYLADPSEENKYLANNFITNEFPQDTYLEYALWYYRNGQIYEALKILEMVNESHPVVMLWKGYLNHLLKRETVAGNMLVQALNLSPRFVFPSGAETLIPLDWAQTISDDWKIKYYKGLIFLNAGASEKGKDLWESCGQESDFYPFYIARSELYDTGSQQAQDDIERALKLSGSDWRPGYAASKFYLDNGNLKKAEELAEDFCMRNPRNYYLGLQYAKTLELNNKYAECVSLLKSTEVLPNEGASEGRIIWRNANVELALELMRKGKFRKALEYITQAKVWPANLGVGKPYIVDERIEDFIELQCFKKLNDIVTARKIQDKFIADSAELNLSSDLNDFLNILVLKDAGYNAKCDLIMKESLIKHPSSKTIQWCNMIYYDDIDEARKLSNEIGEMNSRLNLKGDNSFRLLSGIFEE